MAIFQNTPLYGETGCPELPRQTVKVLLPPEASLTSVTAEMTGVTFQDLTGLWEVKPVGPRRALSGETEEWPVGVTFCNGRNQSVYQNNRFFPEQNLLRVLAGQQRKWKLATLQIAPYQYNPVTRSLRRLTGGKVIIHYDKVTDGSTSRKDPLSDQLKAKLSEDVINFKEIAPQYEVTTKTSLLMRSSLAVGDATDKPRYVIITTEAIRRQSKLLPQFMIAKQNQGFTVETITETSWGGGVGDAAAEKIRTWLQHNYLSRSIHDVLLIGDPNPETGDVPMKMCWPRYYEKDSRECPTDAYYADLTGNWDINGNGIYGETADFTTAGGADFNYEVVVGRVPYYGEVKDVDAILAKFINYGNSSKADAEWRNQFLFAMEPFSTDAQYYPNFGVEENFRLGEAIIEDVLKPKGGMGWFRIYEQNFNLTPAPDCTPCDIQTVKKVWSTHPFGAFVWATHGFNQSASGIMDLQTVAELNNNYPAYTFQLSCLTAYPEDSQNLSFALLKQGAIGTVGATRNGWGFYPGSITDYGTSQFDLGYRYVKNLVSRNTSAGEALVESKAASPPDDIYECTNYLDFVLYGDPSLGMFTYQNQPTIYMMLPNSVSEMVQGKGTVFVPEAVANNLAVALVSNDPGVRVPSQVIIPAGQRSAEFVINVLRDVTIDQYKTTVITAEAAGYQKGINALRTDNSLKQFSFAAIGTAQVKNTPVPVTITAQDLQGQTPTWYNGSLSLKLINLQDQTESANLQPQTVNLVNGVYAGEVTISESGEYYLQLVDEAGRVWKSNSFMVNDTSNATVDHFSFDYIGKQKINTSFAVRITACAPNGQIVKYSDYLDLQLAFKGGAPIPGNVSPSQVKMVDGVYTGSLEVKLPSFLQLVLVNEANKDWFSDVFEVAGCDLEITKLQLNPGSPKVGEAVPLTVTLKNRGPNSVFGGSEVTFEFWEVGSDGQKLITRETLTLTDNIAMDDTYSYTANTTWVPEREGTHQLMVKFSLSHPYMCEWQSNNELTTEVTVMAP